MEIKGLDSGKIASLPNSENVINLHASFQTACSKNALLEISFLPIFSQLSGHVHLNTKDSYFVPGYFTTTTK